jgi:hypothetical protein
LLLFARAKRFEETRYKVERIEAEFSPVEREARDRADVLPMIRPG